MPQTTAKQRRGENPGRKSGNKRKANRVGRGKTSIVESLKARRRSFAGYLALHRLVFISAAFRLLSAFVFSQRRHWKLGQHQAEGAWQAGKKGVAKGEKAEHKCLANGINMSKTQRSACYKQIVLLLPKKYMKYFSKKKRSGKANIKNKKRWQRVSTKVRTYRVTQQNNTRNSLKKFLGNSYE